MRISDWSSDVCSSDLGDSFGNTLDALGPMPDGIHARHDRQQHLRGTDVRCGFLAANMLLARLQRQTPGGCALAVFGHADQTDQQGALEHLIARQHARLAADKTPTTDTPPS